MTGGGFLTNTDWGSCANRFQFSSRLRENLVLKDQHLVLDLRVQVEALTCTLVSLGLGSKV